MSHLLDVTPFFKPDIHDEWGPPVIDAIEESKRSGHGGIYFPSGVYNFKSVSSAAIEISGVDGFTIAGDGPTSRLFHEAETLDKSTGFLLRIANFVNRVIVRDLMLDGSFTSPETQVGVNDQHHLIRIGGGSNNSHTTHQVRVTNCYLKNCRGDAVNVLGETSAIGILTLSTQANAGGTVTIGDTVYTFVIVLEKAFDVLIGIDIKESIDNLAAAILSGEKKTGFHKDTTPNPKVGRANRDGETLHVHAQVLEPLQLLTTVVNANWEINPARLIFALTDAVIIDHNFIYDTYRTGIGIQRGGRKVIIDNNVIVPARRGVIDCEPTGANVNSEDWHHGNAPQQFIITNNILVKPIRNNTVASLSGIGARDRNKYSIFSHNLCLGGGVDGLNVGPLIIESNIIIGNRGVGGDAVGLINLHRGCEDVIVANNYIERPIPEEGETVALHTLLFYGESDTTKTSQQPSHNATITIGASTYRFRAAPSLLQPNDVRIGSTLAQTCNHVVAAILAGSEEGIAYGIGTVSNVGVIQARAEIVSESGRVTVTGWLNVLSVAEDLAAGHWVSGTAFTSSAGPLIRVFQRGDQPARVSIVNNIGRQHLPATGIDLDSVDHVLVQGNQLHCYHSGDTGSGIVHRSTKVSDQVHIKSNHLMTHGTGRWDHGIRLATIDQLAHSSVIDNTIHGAAIGISYAETATKSPRDIPTVSGNRISGNASAAVQLPQPTCIGGNLGDVALFLGEGKPNFVAPKGSAYMNRNGTIGSTENAPRYLSVGTMEWQAIPNG